MRPKILRYYVKKSADRGECRTLRWIITSEIGIIGLHSIRKLNLIIVLLLAQNISVLNKHISSWTFFKTLSYSLARLRLKQTPYSKKQIIYVLRILAFLPFSFSQKFGSFIFGYPRTMIMNNNCK